MRPSCWIVPQTQKDHVSYTLYLNKLDAAYPCEFAQGGDMMPDAKRQVVGGTRLAPARKEIAHITAEADSGVGISRLRYLSRNRSAFGGDHADFSVAVNVDAEQSHGTCLERKFNTDTAS